MSIRSLFCAASLACALVTGAALAQQPGPQIALTFDDLPAHGPLPPGVTRLDVISGILKALQAGDTPPVYGMVNGIHLVEEPGDAAVLDLWRKEGYPLGNHTWSHMNLNDHTPAEFEADIVRNEPVISSRMAGADWHWLRYPYLAEGNTPEKRDAVRTWLADHGYKIAGVTLSFGDYLFNEPYARCMTKNDPAAISRLEDAYLKAAADDLAFHQQAAQATLGHQIPFVLLMHGGAFDAHMLPRLLALYHQHGVTFVSLEQAERDPFYANDLDPRLPSFPDSLEAALAAKHITLPHPPPVPSDVLNLCR